MYPAHMGPKERVLFLSYVCGLDPRLEVDKALDTHMCMSCMVGHHSVLTNLVLL